MASSSNGLRNRTNWASERVTSSESASWGARKLEKLGNVSTEPAANFYPNEDATAPSGTACPLKGQHDSGIKRELGRMPQREPVGDDLDAVRLGSTWSPAAHGAQPVDRPRHKAGTAKTYEVARAD
eukprot:s637_g21.t1